MRKRWLWTGILLVIVFTTTIVCNGEEADKLRPVTPGIVSQYGQLQVLNGQLCDHTGNPVQLKGMSTMGLQWFDYNGKTVKNLVTDWHISVIRLAMYIMDGGYNDNPAITIKVKAMLEEALRQDIYVIIDWHILSDNNPNFFKNQSKAFFVNMAKKYGAYPNVIYEICNEPNGAVTWEGQIKPYADFIIPAIRAVDPDNIIIVGTDTWSQGVYAASQKPLSYPNIMYTLHFYAGTHGQSLRDGADLALKNGIAIFVTEWGTSQSSGSGGVYLDKAQEWMDWMDAHKISWCNWSLCSKGESSAALNPGSSVQGPWTDSQLSPSGQWVKSKIMGN